MPLQFRAVDEMMVSFGLPKLSQSSTRQPLEITIVGVDSVAPVDTLAELCRHLGEIGIILLLAGDQPVIFGPERSLRHLSEYLLAIPAS